MAYVAHEIHDFVRDWWGQDVLVLYPCCHMYGIRIVLFRHTLHPQWVSEKVDISLEEGRKVCQGHDKVEHVSARWMGCQCRDTAVAVLYAIVRR